MKRASLAMACLVLLWLAGDFVYSCWVDWRIAAWEQTTEWNKRGVIRGCDAYHAGDGPIAVLFIHGLNENPFAWRKMAPWFAARRFRCRVMRLPGFGERTEEYGNYSLLEWKAAVANELAELRRRHDRVYVVAHSLGCAVFINLLLEDGGCADGAVLLAPAIEVSSRRCLVGTTRFWHRISKGLVFTRVVASPFDNDARDPTERAPRQCNIFTPRRVVDQVFELIDANRGRAGEITLPMLVAISRDDQVVDGEAAEQFFLELASPQKQISFPQRAGHVLPYDWGWRELADEAIRFIRRVEISSETIDEP